MATTPHPPAKNDDHSKHAPVTREAPEEPDHMEDIATEQRRRSDALQAEGAAEAAKKHPPEPEPPSSKR